mmetsp:Transcript_19818/g.36741  ORF Transcript_19818/g.36741 Transcript_19818/m.36741 type:complete len:202 (-) Transcript_19818:2352-2957(-)
MSSTPRLFLVLLHRVCNLVENFLDFPNVACWCLPTFEKVQHMEFISPAASKHNSCHPCKGRVEMAHHESISKGECLLGERHRVRQPHDRILKIKGSFLPVQLVLNKAVGHQFGAKINLDRCRRLNKFDLSLHHLQELPANAGHRHFLANHVNAFRNTLPPGPDPFAIWARGVWVESKASPYSEWVRASIVAGSLRTGLLKS